MSTPPICRLSAILAREAPVGVIFRRGPAKWMQIVHWGTSTDTFTPGQWFHGKIDPERSDLSPDGSKLLYFAIKLNGRTLADTEYGTSWTAISKPPYLTALALWPTGYAWGWTYGGGGRFLSNTEIWLMSKDVKPHPDHLPQGLTVCSNGEAAKRLGEIRDGWKCVQDWQYFPGSIRTQGPRIDRKQNPHGSEVLVCTKHTADYKEYKAYTLEDGTGANEMLTGAEWADWDHQGRLVFARTGKLFALERRRDWPGAAAGVD